MSIISQTDKNFKEMLEEALAGELVTNRTGTKTLSALGVQKRYDLRNGFPIVQAKQTFWKKAVAEMLWFMSGDCNNIAGLREMGAESIWKPWQKNEEGDMGPIYGVQWRHWLGYSPSEEDYVAFDQLKEAEKAIKAGSDSRRIIVSAWQPTEISEMALPPCHVLFQFTVRSGGLYLHLYQRSCDLPIGGPFNVAQYSALLMMMAKVSGLEAREFIHTIHDAHIYEDQVPAVQQWIENATDLDSGNSMTEVKRPRMVIQDRGQESFEDFELSDFSMEDYNHMGKIKIPVAV